MSSVQSKKNGSLSLARLIEIDQTKGIFLDDLLTLDITGTLKINVHNSRSFRYARF